MSAQVYKWVDENGVTHYGERPPQGRNATEVPYRLGTPAPAAGSADESARKDQSELQEKPQADPAKRREQCVRQREILARLKRTPPKYEVNEKSERVLADSAERDAAMAKQEQAVLAACGT